LKVRNGSELAGLLLEFIAEKPRLKFRLSEAATPQRVKPTHNSLSVSSKLPFAQRGGFVSRSSEAAVRGLRHPAEVV
jgi:hypothetical protein